MCINVFGYIYTYIYTCIFAYANIHLGICMYAYIHKCICTCIYRYMSIYLYMYMHAYKCCTYTGTYMSVYICKQKAYIGMHVCMYIYLCICACVNLCVYVFSSLFWLGAVLTWERPLQSMNSRESRWAVHSIFTFPLSSLTTKMKSWD